MPNLLLRNLHEVFEEGDSQRRRETIAEIFHADAVFYDPNGTYRGLDQIDAIAASLRAQHPDFRYRPLAAPEVSGDGGRLSWVSGLPGQAPAYAGTDFVVVREGKIAALYLFFDRL
ncbi:hypothetical protein ABS71_04440 [bacterium SCN 62-11]|nr:MAG: hypothetical protein ABS71_04440 [bacterium SCN 62-11]